jgi:kynurenine formamidase
MVERRAFLPALGASAVAGASIGDDPAVAAPVGAEPGSFVLGGKRIRFVDLTHKLTSDFNFSQTSPRIAMDPIVGSSFAAGMNLNRVLLVEHTGTHIDVPRHFAKDGRSLGEVPLSDLIVPLVVIDLRARAAADPDTALIPDDILSWERQHGRLPTHCCVAINSGWDPFTRAGSGNGAPTANLRGSPGFTLEAVKMLVSSRDVKGIAVDALTLDRGTNAPAYPVHQFWLRSGRWGIEGLTNLDAVPPSGAMLIVGAAPIKDATGFPIRAMALF